MSAESLEEALAAITPGRDPDGWAVAAYRAAVARSETATGEGDVRRALDLLDRAGRILTVTRSPVEHARILTATANCHRQLGLAANAADLFDQAVELLRSRATPAELAAALINQGLGRVEVGRASDAVGPLSDAIDLVAGSTDDQDRRVHGAALVNRAQAHQAIGTVQALRVAADDYSAASRVLDEESPQRGMALHGLGATIMELLALGDVGRSYDDAVAVFTASLRVLTVNAFPFQHAVAQHSLAIAHERRGALLDLERAMNHVEIALTMFDPRLHPGHWRTAAEALGRIDARLAETRPSATRADHFVALVAGVDESARTELVRDRLVPLSRQPGARIRRDLDGLMSALASLAAPEYDTVVRSMLPVLMELPEIVLSAACAALCAAHQATDQASAYDAILDGVVHDLLHGPQRVRVRDMLAANGWIRP